MKIIKVAGRVFKAPYWDLVPRPTKEEREELKTDIQKRGIQIRIIHDEFNNILDGNTRAEIAEEIGLKEIPTIEKRGLSEEEKLQLAVKLNTVRRQLTPEKRKAVTLKLAKLGKSIRGIADTMGVPRSTVHRDLSEVSQVGQVLRKVTGLDGKEYPARQERRKTDNPGTFQTETKTIPIQEEIPKESNETPEDEEKAEAKREVYLRSKYEHWNTPPEVLNPIKSAWDIGLDPCSNKHSFVGARTSFSKEEDGLSKDWHKYGRGLVFVNPPFGKECAKWVDKAYWEAAEGAEILLLVPARTDQDWFQECIFKASALCFWKGRLTFWKEGKPGDGLSTFPTVLAYFGPGKMAFEGIFSKFGTVVLKGDFPALKMQMKGNL